VTQLCYTFHGPTSDGYPATKPIVILCDNLNALAVHAASEALDADTRAHYLINRGDTFSRLKRTLGGWLLHGRDALDNVALVFGQLIKNLVRKNPTDHSQENLQKSPFFIRRLQERCMTLF
jgi:hypothetical protein